MSPRARLLIVWLLSLSLTAAFFASLTAVARRDARDARRMADVALLRYALESHFNDCLSYPLSLVPGGEVGGAQSCAGRTYLKPVPAAPSGGAYSYVPCGLNAEGRTECSTSVKRADSYVIEYSLERDYGDVRAGRHQATPEKMY